MLSSFVIAFRDFLLDYNLNDIDSLGSTFTWCTNRFGVSQVSTGLDIALAYDVWLYSFLHAHVKHLPQKFSDHTPLLISLNHSDHAKNTYRPFRFGNINKALINTEVEIKALELKENNSTLTLKDHTKLRCLHNKFTTLSRQIHLKWSTTTKTK